MDFDFGHSFGLPFALSPFARLIPTFAGSQYGTIDTPITFTGDFEVEVELATTNTATTQALFGYSISGTTNYFQIGTGAFALLTDDGQVLWTHGNSHSDGKIHTLTAYRIGNTLGIKLDGVIKNTNTLGAASTVDINLLGCLGIATVPSQFFSGELLSVKFTDNSGTPVVTNFVFDSGSTTDQPSRGGGNNVTLVNFATTDWNPYTQQRNIAHDAGTISEAWVGDNLVINGTFDADTDWSKGTGWSIGSGVASCDGSQISSTELQQTPFGFIAGASYLCECDAVITTQTLVFHLGAGGGINVSVIDGHTKGIGISGAISFDALRMEADINFVGSIDNVTAQRLLEVA